MRVVSGGQDGADIAGLRAAKDAGLPTAGWLPLGCSTHSGPRPEYLTLYGMKEHCDAHYKGRTWANVMDSQATLRLAHNFESAGEKCTFNALVHYKRPKFDIYWESGVGFDAAPEEVAEWVKLLHIKVLNVAGNSERTAKGIGAAAYEFLLEAFKIIKGEGAAANG